MPVDSLHPEYAASSAKWARCRDVFNGEDAVKARRTAYLPLLAGQTDASTEYTGYLARAMLYPAFGRTISGLTGLTLRRAPVVPDAGEPLNTHLVDLTLTGQSLSSVVGLVIEETLITGRAALALDWAGADDGRPYWALFKAEDIINWREETQDGKPVTTLVVVREVVETGAGDAFAHPTEVRYRVWLLDGEGETAQCRVEEWRARRTGERAQVEWIKETEHVPLRRGVPLTFIPVVPIGPTSDLRWTVHRPPLDDLATVVLSHYRTTADLEHGAHFTALPTPYVTGWQGAQEKLEIGSGTAWLLSNAEAKVGMLEYTGAGLSALEARAKDKEQKMAVLGARMLEAQPAVQETAEAVRLRHTAEHGSLVALVDAVSLSLSTMLRWHLWWVGPDEPDIEVSLNRDFLSSRLDAQQLQALIAAWQGGAISAETLYWNLQQGEVARPNVSWAEEQALIEAEGPEDEPVVPEPEPPPVPIAGAPPPQMPFEGSDDEPDEE